MSNNRLAFEGLAELKAALRALPAELKAQSSRIVRDAANSAAGEIRADYARKIKHQGTGKLVDGVSVLHEDTTFSTGAIVINKSKIANIFENGSQARHTDLGYNRGSMPPGHVFIPVVTRRRRRMYEELAEMLKHNGLQVSGDASGFE